MSLAEEIAKKKHITFDEFVGKMRLAGYTEPTARKIWNGEYGNGNSDIFLTTLQAAAKILDVSVRDLLE